MTVIETYAPGTFCWADLGTPDAAAAKRFYTGLFGWTAEDRPMGPDATYTMLQLHGNAVAALYQQERQPDIPPHWISYISVTSADDLTQRTRALGGTVLMEAFDVLDVGRMAMIQDPTGAVVAIWEPRGHIGAGVVGEVGALCWNELATRDPAKAASFFQGLLGWRAEPQRSGVAYTYFKLGDASAGGMIEIRPEWGAMPSVWFVYFAVGDCDGTAALAQSLGGQVKVPPSDIAGVGRFAMIEDPQGAAFAIIKVMAL